MRLFVAIALDDQVKEAMLTASAAFEAERKAHVRWLKKDQLHLTLKFLGEVDERRLPEIEDVLHGAAERTAAFSLKFSRCGCFPERGPVRIVWIGGEQCPAELLSCQTILEEGFEKLGFKKEDREFSPHITIGRVKEDQSRGTFCEAIKALSFKTVAQEVRYLSLYESFLQSSGARYELLENEPLRS